MLQIDLADDKGEIANPSKLASVQSSLHQHARMVEREQELQRHAVLESIQALIEALESRDPLTHSWAHRPRPRVGHAHWTAARPACRRG